MELTSVVSNEYKKSQSQLDKGQGGIISAERKNLFECAFDSVPIFRRVESIPDKIKKGDDITALGMAALALINLPEDGKDIVGACRQIKSYLTGKKFEGAYDYKNYQHDFSFTRGSAIEKWLWKNEASGHKWASWLLNNDITLADTELGEKFLKAIKVEVKDFVPTSIENAKGAPVSAFAYEGTKFGELTARAMKRTTKLGLMAMAALEIPKIWKAMTADASICDRTSNTLKQGVKSGINIASITAGIAYGGAIGSKYGKGFGSLVGMGVGAVVGSKISEKTQQSI